MLLDPRTTGPSPTASTTCSRRLPRAARARTPRPRRTPASRAQDRRRTRPSRRGRRARQLRRSLDGALRDELGLRAAVAGTHPLATRSRGRRLGRRALPADRGDDAGAGAPRADDGAARPRRGARRATTAVRALDGLRGELPLLLALSANSPFWRGRDSGLRLDAHADLLDVPARRDPAALRQLRRVRGGGRADAALRRDPRPGFLWWDARLRPRLGTVEVRIMDAQSRAADAAALAALVQCLVAPPRRARGATPRRRRRRCSPRTASSPRATACDAQLIDDRIGAALRPTCSRSCSRTAGHTPPRSGCRASSADVAALARDPGHARQRRLAARRGLDGLVASLAEDFAHAGRAIAV